jgi:predicted dehydrogenase
MIRFGVLGYGYWGPNIVRNLRALDGVKIESVFDPDPLAQSRLKRDYPDILIAPDVHQIMESKEIDAIAVITPPSTHYNLTKYALENGKHVFVEKPFTISPADALELIQLSEKNDLALIVDHTFLFTGAVGKISELITNKMLGKIYYYDSMRVNLGLFQHNTDVLYDLAYHDIYLIDFLINQKPDAVVATGRAHLNSQIDSAYITIYYKDNTIAHVNVNWLSPVKIRTTLIGGDKNMLVWNDLDPYEKIKVYNCGVKIPDVREALVSYRTGDVWSPKINQSEALQVELKYFLDYIKGGFIPINGAYAAYRVVKILKAAEESIKTGREIYL